MGGTIEEALMKELKMLTNKVYEVEANQRNMMKLLNEMNDRWSNMRPPFSSMPQPSGPSESPKINAMVTEIQGLKSMIDQLDKKLMQKLSKLDEIGKPVVLNVSVDSQQAAVDVSPKPILSRASLDPESIQEENRVTQLLGYLGVPNHIKGFSYLKDAILIMLRDSEAHLAITRHVYPVIAEKYRTTPSRVERAIRHAVGVCWVRIDPEVIREVFGSTSTTRKSVPTNLDFITMSARWCQGMDMKK